MSGRFLFSFCLSLALSFISAQGADAVETGSAAPQFTANDINGKEHSLESYKGKIVILEWTNPGCPFVRKHYDSGNMQATQKLAIDNGAVWLVINSSAEGQQGHLNEDEAKAQQEKDKGNETAYILDHDGTIGRLYGATTTPHMFIINADGNIAYHGAIDSKPTATVADIETAQNYVKSALESLFKGDSPEITESKAYGCAVKYGNKE